MNRLHGPFMAPLLICIILLPYAFALFFIPAVITTYNTTITSNSTTICDISGTLQSDSDYSTARRVETWVHDNIDYQLYDGPRGNNVTWQTRTGDCTDMAMLAHEMLSCLNITSSTTHGFVDGRKHDWLEVKYRLFDEITGELSGKTSTMIIDPTVDYPPVRCEDWGPKYTRVGSGVW